MMKTCIKCELQKIPAAFPKEKSLVCKKCKVMKTVQKSLEFIEKEDIGIENIKKDEKIDVISKYFRPTRPMDYEDVISIADTIKLKAINETEVYLLEFYKVEKEDILTRINVLERDGYICYYCEKNADTVDHVIPKSKGGGFTEENLVASCGVCNVAKGNNFFNKEQVAMEIMKKEEYKKEKANRASAVASVMKSRQSKEKNKNEIKVERYYNPYKKTENDKGDVSEEKAVANVKPLSLEELMYASLRKKKQKWE